MIKKDLNYICNYFFKKFSISFVQLKDPTLTGFISINNSPYYFLGPIGHENGTYKELSKAPLYSNLIIACQNHDK